MNMIGAYGPWMAELANDPPQLSFRSENGPMSIRGDPWLANERLTAWPCRTAAARLRSPWMISTRMTVCTSRNCRGSCPMDRGLRRFCSSRPAAAGRLPGILALHDHAGNKYFGKRKIARTSDAWHPMLIDSHAPPTMRALPGPTRSPSAATPSSSPMPLPSAAGACVWAMCPKCCEKGLSPVISIPISMMNQATAKRSAPTIAGRRSMSR